MSKSRGNTVDPLDWIDRFGADATRFTLARGASPGGDIAVSEEWVTGARNFCNKLWNATRFALLNGATVPDALPAAASLSTADRWILSRLAAVTAEVDELYEQFEFGKICEALVPLRLGRGLRLVPGAGQDRPVRARRQAGQVTREVLGYLLDRLLRLLHPVIPFVTEELWTALTGGSSVMTAAWPGEQAQRGGRAARPRPGGRGRDRLAHGAGDRGAPVPFRPGPAAGPAGPRRAGRDRRHAAGRPRGRHPLAAAADPTRRRLHPDRVPGRRGVTVELDTAATIDVAAERRRMEKDLAAARKEADQAERKLANDAFLAKAPGDVVDETRR